MTTKSKTDDTALAVPDSLKAELNALSGVEDVTPAAPADVEAIAKIDPDQIFIPEAFTSDEDKAYLKNQGIEILNIGRKADAAIKQIVAQIKGRATLEIGKKLCEIYDHFNDRDLDKLPGWSDYVKSIGLNVTNSYRYQSAARTLSDYKYLLGDSADPSLILKTADNTLSAIQTSLPDEVKAEVLVNIAVGETPPTHKEIKELAARPEVKLTKKEELLQQAKAKLAQKTQTLDRIKEEVRADPTVTARESAEYTQAQSEVVRLRASVEKQEAQLVKLRAEAAEAKERAARLAEERAAMEAELEAMKFDDAAAREQRVKRISHTLPNLIPQALADLQRYIAEKVHYEPEAQRGIDDQVKTFIAYCKEHYD